MVEAAGGTRSQLYLHLGHLHAASVPTTVTTILGSCVSVCLYDPVRRQGGVNHYLLPHGGAGADMSPRFGGAAIARLVERMAGLGSAREDIRAKVFGGACVLEAFRARTEHLGTRNVEIARRVLRDEGISVLAEDVGGTRSRKLLFQTDDGTAWVRLI
jgi:chemotaxis protein CheD